MNRSIRRLGIVLIACYVALFAQLNWVQVFSADELNDHPANTRRIQREFNRARGLIVTADDHVVAESLPVTGEAFDLQRNYPEPELFAHLTGYFSFLYGASGLEQTYNAELAGDTFGQQLRGFRDLLVDREVVGNLHLSVRRDLQTTARDALGEREGSVVALDPRTGEILAFWSYPSYDPNRIASVDLAASTVAWDEISTAEGNPLRANQYRERYFPGSTFKVVTAGVGLAQGTLTPTSPNYPVERSWTPPLTTFPISNFGGSSCGGTLDTIMARSCNTSFARMGVETIGPDAMVAGVRDWGFEDAPPIDLPDPGVSVFPTDFTQDLPRLAQASIGQNDVATTPLQMAMVAAAVANDGEMLRPTVVSEVRNSDGEQISSSSPQVWRTPLEVREAAQLRRSMVAVVESGTARQLARPGFEVGAKTGTAQLGTEPPRSHTWMIAFAGPPGDPQVAVAVVVLNQPGDVAGATGGAIAGPIAEQMIDAALAVRAGETREPLESAGDGVPAADVPDTTTAPSPTSPVPAPPTPPTPPTPDPTAPPTTDPPPTTAPVPTTETPTTTETVPAGPDPPPDGDP